MLRSSATRNGLKVPTSFKTQVVVDGDEVATSKLATASM